MSSLIRRVKLLTQLLDIRNQIVSYVSCNDLQVGDIGNITFFFQKNWKELCVRE